MAEELHLEADDDHVQRLADEGEPVRAFVELIRKALDAEAHNVAVVMGRDEMDAITRTTVTGVGIFNVDQMNDGIQKFRYFEKKSREGVW